MEFGQPSQNPGRRLTGIGLVVLLHLGLVYVLVTGLARKSIELLPPPIETRILRDVPPPVPPPPPPPPPPKFVPPPSTFVPPPEIVISTPPPRPAAITPTTTTPPPPPAAQATVSRVAPSMSARHSCRTPEYPAASEHLGEEGTVQLSFLIGVDGRVADSRIDRSSGYQRLDQAALQALSRCTFEPGTANGVPQAAWFSMKYVWKIPE